MFSKTKTVFVGVVLAVALGACTSKPVYSVDDAPVTTSSGKAAQAAQVRTAIVSAGTSLGWQIVETSPGVMQGTLNLRGHTAVVEIPYSVKSYSIKYKSSVNLGEKEGNIHKNYNGWVQNLDNKIRAEISRL
jgi:hypothetical protein